MSQKKSDNSASHGSAIPASALNAPILPAPVGKGILNQPWLRTLLALLPLLLLFLLPPLAHVMEDKYDDTPYYKQLATDQNVDSNLNRVDPTHARVLMLIGINVILAVSLQLINGISGQFSLGHAGFMAVGAYLAGYATNNFAEKFERKPDVLLYLVSLAVVVIIFIAVLAVVFALVRASRKLHRQLPLVLFLLVFVWIVADLSMTSASNMRVWSKLLSELNTLFTSMTTQGQKPLTLLLAIIGGGAGAALVGLLVGLPTLRLRGDYLAIATLGFAAIIEMLITITPSLGAATGMQLTPYATRPGDTDNGQGNYIFPWIYGAAIICILVVWRLSHSAKGRAIKAVREDEIAAAAIGIDTTRYKITAFVVGAFFAGVAGAIFAHMDAYLQPRQFGLIKSIEIVVMVTVGGLGNIWGAVFAAILLTFLPEFLRQPEHWINLFRTSPHRVHDLIVHNLQPMQVEPLKLPQWLSKTFAEIGENRMAVYALLLIVIMLARGRNYSAWITRWFRRSEPSKP